MGSPNTLVMEKHFDDHNKFPAVYTANLTLLYL